MPQKGKIGTICLILLASTLLASARASEHGQSVPLSRNLGFFAEAYSANRESFSSFTCRFTLIRAKAQSIEDALKGNLTDRMSANGLWVVDGPNVRYELKSDEKLWQELEKKAVRHERGNEVIMTIPAGGESEDYISDGSYSLSLDPRFKGANIYPPTSRSTGYRFTPFSMGVMGNHENLSPAALLRRCMKGEFVGRYEGKEYIRGTEVAVFRVGRPSEILRLRFSLDPKRGFLPVQYSDIAPEKGKRIDEAYMTDIKECSRGRWFPMRTVTVWDPDLKPPFPVHEIKVYELDVDHRPKGDLLRVRVPGGTQINDSSSQAGLLDIHQDRWIRVSELKKYHDACLKNNEAYQMRLQQMPPEPLRESNNLAVILTSIGGICLTLTVGLLVVRYYRRRRTNGMA